MPRTVLCVDNDRDLVHIVSKALETEGYRVQTAYDGDAAVRMVREEPPDLVLLDLILPKRDGFAVLEAIRSEEGGPGATPVLLLTGCTPGPEYRRRAHELGAAALLSKPIPLDDLLQQVAEHAVKDGAAAQASRSGPPLSGSLGSLPLPALLHHLRGLRATGVLHLVNGKRRKWLEVRDGYPVAVRSNLVSECLGNFLVRTGRIERSALEESRRRMIAGKLQGEILVAMEVLREEEIPGVLREQAEEKLFEIFSWRSGSFRFDIGGRLQGGSELPLGTSPANLILRGVRDRLPLQQVDRYLRANGDAYASRSGSPFYRFQDIELDPEHRELLDGLDGSRKLVELCEGAEPLRRALYALVATGMLELRGGKPPGGLAPESVPSSETPAVERPDDETLRAELTGLAERMRSQDHFQVLGVAASDSDHAIRVAYERLSATAHPDRVSGASPPVKKLAAEVSVRVAEAYEVLSSPSRRTEYLLERKRAQRQQAERAEERAALDAELQFQDGEAALRARDYPRSVSCFRRAVELSPESGEYHAHLGWAIHLANPDNASRLAEAIGHVKQGLKLARDSEKPYLYMGRLLKAADRTDAAEKMFTRAVQIQPECFEALRELRLINMRREKSKGFVRRLLRR